MYDIKKRRQFDTVAELRALLEDLPGGMNVTICGQSSSFYHEEEDKSGICLDYSDLAECCGEEPEVPEEGTWQRQLWDRQNNLMKLFQEYTGGTKEQE